MYGEFEEISGSSTYKETDFSNFYGEKGLKLALMIYVDPG
jgi:hypothetical protein